MRLDSIPTWILFAGSILLVLVAVEAGYRLGGLFRRKSEGSEESSASAASAAVLGLVAFMLAFTFGIVGERYYGRIGLVRADANAIVWPTVGAPSLPNRTARGQRPAGHDWVARLSAVRSETSTAGQGRTTATWIHGACGKGVHQCPQDMNSDVASLYSNRQRGHELACHDGCERRQARSPACGSCWARSDSRISAGLSCRDRGSSGPGEAMWGFLGLVSP